ncbi:MAG: acyl-CoA desaturase, partial [Glaciihabitans sp.]|nr:acyl-CoA desaturase [Glaciihabitans sp.]
MAGKSAQPRGTVTSTNPAAAAPRIIKTGQRGLKNPTSDFSALLSTIRDAGLLHRTRTFYIINFAAISLVMAAAWVAFAFLGDSWYQLIVAAVLGLLFTQYAFVAHEAAHRQVFTSGKANDTAGRIVADLLVGISYSWWMTKHTRHHANPNTVGKDPDIEPDFIIFQEEHAKGLKGISKVLAQRQGWLFFPALTLEGLNLHAQAFRTVFGKDKVDKRWVEIILLLVRNLGYLSVVFAFLPFGMACAFIGVQMAVFGVYMGASFAPNHKGMPQLPRD